MISLSVSTEIAMLHKNLILHSFLYYELDETLIPDSQFDHLRGRLKELHTAHPDLAKQAPFYEVGKQFVESPSGFFIRKLGYPEKIVSAAFRVLYKAKTEGMPLRESFPAFVTRYGFHVIGE